MYAHCKPRKTWLPMVLDVLGEMLARTWPYLVLGLSICLSLAVLAHVVLHKRDARSAIAWAGLVLLSPFVGAILYGLFGINRVRRKAVRLKEDTTPGSRGTESGLPGTPPPGYGSGPSAWRDFMDGVTTSRLLPGNHAHALIDGDGAYPDMLRAIRGARHSVGLCTYIFDYGGVGSSFVQELAAAVERGVQVRVLIDGVGARYSERPTIEALRKRGVPAAEFLRSVIPWRNPYLNLRNHRKLLIIDGRLGYTGSVNIRASCVLAADPPHPTRDVHFRFIGPVVAHFTQTFALDWHFTTGERLHGGAWYPHLPEVGHMNARGIPDGPDEDFEAIRWAMLGALSRARQSVRILTPYFVPDQTLITSLNLAAMRGVSVDIVIPERNNLRFVQWAAMAQAGQLLERGCRLWLSPAPFDHSKLMVVDNRWALVGSANWDSRSLRLNFEFNVECQDRAMADTLARLIDQRKTAGRPLTLDETRGRSLPVKVRDGVARLFMPYL